MAERVAEHRAEHRPDTGRTPAETTSVRQVPCLAHKAQLAGVALVVLAEAVLLDRLHELPGLLLLLEVLGHILHLDADGLQPRIDLIDVHCPAVGSVFTTPWRSQRSATERARSRAAHSIVPPASTHSAH